MDTSNIWTTVLPGEESIEALWKDQKGVDPNTGNMWLTPRMERAAAVLTKKWEEEANQDA